MQDDAWLTEEVYVNRWPTAVSAFREELAAARVLFAARVAFIESPSAENEIAMVHALAVFTLRHSESDRACLADERDWRRRKLERNAEKQRIAECAACLLEEVRRLHVPE